MVQPQPVPEPNGPVSRKIVAQALTNILVALVTFVATKQGLNISTDVSSEIAGLASVLSGLWAGWLIRDPGPVNPPPQQ